MKDNRLWWVLTLFSLSLNLGVIGYLVYLRLSPPPFPPPQPGPGAEPITSHYPRHCALPSSTTRR